MRPIRNFTRPRTSASLLRGRVIANVRTSSIVTTDRRRSGYEPAVLAGRWRCLGLTPVWSPHRVISVGGPYQKTAAPWMFDLYCGRCGARVGWMPIPDAEVMGPSEPKLR